MSETKTIVSTKEFIAAYRAAVVDESQTWDTFSESIGLKKASAVVKLSGIRKELREGLASKGFTDEQIDERLNAVLPPFAHRSARSGSDKREAIDDLMGELENVSVASETPAKTTPARKRKSK